MSLTTELDTVADTLRADGADLSLDGVDAGTARVRLVPRPMINKPITSKTIGTRTSIDNLRSVFAWVVFPVPRDRRAGEPGARPARAAGWPQWEAIASRSPTSR